MKFLQKLLCSHQWEKTYSYASLKDVFASSPGNIDRSGTIYIGQECKNCGSGRTKITIFDKDGSERTYYKKDRKKDKDGS